MILAYSLIISMGTNMKKLGWTKQPPWAYTTVGSNLRTFFYINCRKLSIRISSCGPFLFKSHNYLTKVLLLNCTKKEINCIVHSTTQTFACILEQVYIFHIFSNEWSKNLYCPLPLPLKIKKPSMASSPNSHVVIFPFMSHSHTLPLIGLSKALSSTSKSYHCHNPIKF